MYLTVPISQATQVFQQYSEAKVAATRIAQVLNVTPLTCDDQRDKGATAHAPTRKVPEAGTGKELTLTDFASAMLCDETSGVCIKPGIITAIVSADPLAPAHIAERLARIDDHYRVTATWGEHTIALQSFALADVRAGIVLSDAIAQLFQGTLRSNLEASRAAWPLPRSIAQQMEDTGDGSGIAHREHKDNPVAYSDTDLAMAMITADASEITLSLPGGLAGYVAERGRSLSGGQRQRVALARAVLSEAPVLILIEPTSAVDSHTESRIAHRLSKQRHGKTTVIVSTSPIVLNEVDEVILVDNQGKELVRATHHQLQDDTRYRNIVNRASGVQ